MRKVLFGGALILSILMTYFIGFFIVAFLY